MRRRTTVALLAIGACALWTLGPPTLAGGVSDEVETCLECHEEPFIEEFPSTPHGRIDVGDWFGAAKACSSCHGDPTEHNEEGDLETIRAFPGDPAADAEVCLACHTSASHMGSWLMGEHAMAGVTCTDCHSIHGGSENVAVRARDAAAGHRVATVSSRTCYQCHDDVMAQMRMPSHHPVGEGKMECVDCHDPHGANPGMLKTAMRTNDLCYECHAAKQGPFIFQHDPVEDDCMTCHSPHGTVANNLLTQTEPFLCLQCHEGHFHAGLISPEGEAGAGWDGGPFQNPNGIYSLKYAMLTKCSQCHSSVHGSDLPSQSNTSQGESLLR